MAKTPDDYATRATANVTRHHTDLAAFHQREADKYDAKADQLEHAGKARAAARSRKVADRNRAKALEHQAKLG